MWWRIETPALRWRVSGAFSRLGWSLLTALGVNTLSLLVGLIMTLAMINR
jgi:hypothetical protein